MNRRTFIGGALAAVAGGLGVLVRRRVETPGGRMVFVGTCKPPPSTVYMSRVGDPFEFDAAPKPRTITARELHERVKAWDAKIGKPMRDARRAAMDSPEFKAHMAKLYPPRREIGA